MRKKTSILAQLFPVGEALSPIRRQEITLRTCLILTEVLLLVLVPINCISWRKSPNTAIIFNLANDIVGMFLLGLIYYINNKHWTKTASILYLGCTFYLSFSSFPVLHPDQILFYMTLPTLIASLITRKEGSIIVALLAIVSTVIYKLKFFPDEVFPTFSALCLLIIGIVASRVAVILDQILQQMTLAYDKTIEGWSKALEMRNQETEGHSNRVVELTLNLARFMQVDDEMMSQMRPGVLLHDIGKIAVPDLILCKSGPLTKEEIKVMHRHPEFAYDMLKGIPYLTSALQIPYCHHEKWDGTGYPRGLKGVGIPLEARIFSVVDVWDAMRSDRSYRKAIPENQVVEYLRCEKGRSFDPEVIDAFFKMMHFKGPARRHYQIRFKEAGSSFKI